MTFVIYNNNHGNNKNIKKKPKIQNFFFSFGKNSNFIAKSNKKQTSDSEYVKQNKLLHKLK